MLIRVSGGSSGIVQYLANGRKSGRLYSREELDQRVELHGKLASIDAILDSFDPQCSHQKYLHITLSFKEPHIDQEILQKIDSEFRQFIFTACREDEFAYYSEAHLPKIKALRDINGDEYVRFPHIHVVLPEYNLYTGKRDNPLGKIENITHYINAFQELVNQKYGLESPKDNIREISTGREEILNRYKLQPDSTVKEVKSEIFRLIREHSEITSVDILAEVIKPFGKVTVRDSKKFGGKYLNLQIAGKDKGINLKDAVFLDAYLVSRDKAVTQQFDSEAHQELYDRWLDYGAREARFLRNASKRDRAAYSQMNSEEKKDWLAVRWIKHEAMLDTLVKGEEPRKPANIVEIGDTRTAYPDVASIAFVNALPFVEELRHIDDIPHIYDLPHFGDSFYIHNEDNGHERRERFGRTHPEDSKGAGGLHLHDLRIWRGDGRGDDGKTYPADSLPSDQRADVVGNEEGTPAHLYPSPTARTISTAGRIRGELSRAIEEKEPSWSEIINALDTRHLLDYLAYHYALNTDSLRIERNKSGHERIADDGRRYSPSDFLTRRMNMTWPEARMVLQTIHAQQQTVEQRQRAVNSKLLWHRFERYESRLPGITAIRADYRKRREAILAESRFQPDATLSKAQNAVKRRLLRERRRTELEQLKQDQEAELRYYRQRPHDRFLEYLYEQAKKGDGAELDELNRIYPVRALQEAQAFEIHIRERQRPNTLFKPADMGYTVAIRRNGTVEYRDEEQQVVIVDTFASIKVQERRADVIANALELAKLRYGVNGFEIRNATQQDLAAIEAAVRATGTSVKVLPKEPAKERDDGHER